MLNNKRLQILRGTYALTDKSELLDGQPVYDQTWHVVRIGDRGMYHKGGFTIDTTEPLNLEDSASLGKTWTTYLFNKSNITWDTDIQYICKIKCPSLTPQIEFYALKYEISSGKIYYRNSNDYPYTYIEVYSPTTGWVDDAYRTVILSSELKYNDITEIIPEDYHDLRETEPWISFKKFLDKNAQSIGTRVIDDIFEEHSNYVKNATKAENAAKAETITLSQAIPTSKISEGQMAICITDSIPTNPSPNVLYITTL